MAILRTMTDPFLLGETEQPMGMAPVPDVQHPMHAMIAPISPKPEPDPMVAFEQGQTAKPASMSDQTEGTQVGGENQKGRIAQMSPLDPYEEALKRRQMADFAKDENPYGSEGNHPGFFGKFLHGLSTATGGPGRRLLSEQDRAAQIQGIEKAKSEQALQGAQTENQEAQPELKQAKADLDAEKADETKRNHDMQLRTHGFKVGEDGQVVPLAYEEMSPDQQAVHDLKGAQEEEAEATAALRKSQADPSSPAYQLAAQRVQNARNAQSIAAQRLGLSEQTFAARYRGTDTSGNALPGAMITDQGQPVGSSFSQNVRPTGTERNKGDMARSADQQIDDMASIVAKRPDIFGPAAGRKTDFNVWVGSQDPDAQRFRAARTIAGDHLAGTFGGRSEAALDALDAAIGHFKDNPKAIQAGLSQLKEANHLFLKAGSVRTAGSNVNANVNAPVAPTFKVKLSDAMGLPANKGKSESEVEADVKKHGGEVVR